MLIFFCSIGGAYGQRPADFELWADCSYELQLNKRFSVNIDEQFRFNDTISSLKKSFTQISVEFKLNKYLSFAGNYRYTVVPLDLNRHRISLDANLKLARKNFPLSFKYRIRFQDEEYGKRQTYLRNKVQFEYNLCKLVDPFVSYEMFLRFNGKNEFRISRFSAGLEWRILKNLSATTFYKLQDDIFIKKPERQHIFGISAAYKMKLKKNPTTN